MSLAHFQHHDMQVLLALFLTKPELYADYKKERNLQDYFFRKFHQFSQKYYSASDLDVYVYFGSISVSAAGSVSACAGMGKISGSSKAYFKKRIETANNDWQKRVNDFERKYKVNLSKSDPRTFLGEREIWTKLDRALDIVAKSYWPDVAQIEYSDATFTTPIPEALDKRLVPLDIRNKVCQKHDARNRIYRPHIPSVDYAKLDEEEELAFQRKREISLATGAATHINLEPEDLEDW